MDRVVFNPPDLPAGKTYVHAIRAGNLLFLNGQVAVDAQGELVGRDDIRAQARQVYRNLLAALRSAGAGPEHIVRLDSYYVDPSHRAAILEARREILGDIRPCSTSVIVAGLAAPEWLLEVQAIAVPD